MLGVDLEENRQERAYFLPTNRPRGSMLAPSRPTISRLQNVVSNLILESGCEPRELGVTVSNKLDNMIDHRIKGVFDPATGHAKITMPGGQVYELSLEDVNRLRNVVEKIQMSDEVSEIWWEQRKRYRADLFKTLQVAEKHGISIDKIGVDVKDLRFALKRVYQNPKTLETWSGKGVKPKWVREWIDKGLSLDELLTNE